MNHESLCLSVAYREAIARKVSESIKELAQAGVNVRLDDQQRLAIAPASRLSDQMRRLLRLMQAELKASLLSGEYPPDVLAALDEFDRRFPPFEEGSPTEGPALFRTKEMGLVGLHPENYAWLLRESESRKAEKAKKGKRKKVKEAPKGPTLFATEETNEEKR